MPSTEISINLDTKIIAPSQQIWVVHSGHERRLLREFIDKNAAFLEFPGLDLDARILGDAEALRQRLRYSEALKRAKGHVNSSGGQIQRHRYRGEAGNDTTIPYRIVRALFSRAKKGDLIVTPTGGAFQPILFGEIETDFSPNEKLRSGRFSYEDVNYRKIKWLKTEARVIDVPYELATLIRKPPAVSQIKRTPDTERIFDFAYKSYVKGNEGWSLISAPGYDGRDPLALITPNELISFCVALYNASANESSLADLTFDQIITEYYSNELIESFGQQFASPGRYSFKAKDPKLAIFVTAMIAVLGSGALITASTSKSHAALTDSHSTPSQDMAQSEKQLNYTLNSLGDRAIKVASDKAAKAKSDVDLKADANVAVTKK